MVPFNLQLELNARPVTISAEQIDQIADNDGFMRYQVRTFNQRSVVFVKVENDLSESEDITGFSEEDAFSPDEIKAIAAAIWEYNSSRKLNFDQMHFDF